MSQSDKKPKIKAFTARLPDPLYKRLRKEAENSGRSLNSQLVVYLNNQLVK